jgi:hypothetical protein
VCFVLQRRKKHTPHPQTQSKAIWRENHLDP